MDETVPPVDSDDHELRENWQGAMELVDIESSPQYEFEERVRRGLEVLTTRSGFPLAYLAYIDDDQQEFRVVSDDAGFEGVVEGRTSPLSDSYCRFTVAGNPELTVLNAGRDIPRDDPAYETFGFETYVGIPVRVGGNLYGTLCLADADPDQTTPSKSFRSFLSFVATWIGSQIQLHEQHRHTAVLQRVLRHNLRNSLNLIDGYASTLPDLDRCHPALDIIKDEVSTLVQLSHEAQDIETILQERTRLRQIDLDSVIRSVLEDVRRGFPHASIDGPAVEGVTVSAIPKLRFAVEELVTNAIEHSDRPAPAVEVTVVQNGREVEIRIADDGPGIPEKESRPLSDPREIDPINHGTGLGLWLVRLIVQQSNGSVSVGSNEPRGTIVTITLHRPEPERAE